MKFKLSSGLLSFSQELISIFYQHHWFAASENLQKKQIAFAPNGFIVGLLSEPQRE
jgi:hypothetical protein